MKSLTSDKRDTVHNLFSNDARLRLNTIKELRYWRKRRALALLGRLRKDDDPNVRKRVGELITFLSKKSGK